MSDRSMSLFCLFLSSHVITHAAPIQTQVTYFLMEVGMSDLLPSGAKSMWVSSSSFPSSVAAYWGQKQEERSRKRPICLLGKRDLPTISHIAKHFSALFGRGRGVCKKSRLSPSLFQICWNPYVIILITDILLGKITPQRPFFLKKTPSSVH